MKLQLLRAVAVTALMAMPSLASANDEGWYVRGNIGYGIHANSEFAGDLVGDVEGEGNVALSLGVGYEFGNNWRLEVDAVQIWNDLGAIGQHPGTSADIRTTSLMLNAIYDFDGFGNWEPYIGAGLGIVRADVSAFANDFANGVFPVDNPACANGPSCVFTDTDGGIGFQLLAGLGYKITDNLTWDTAYRYQSFGDFTFEGTSVPTTGSALSLTSNSSGVGSHSILTGLRYRFGASTPAPTYTCWDGSVVASLATCPVEPVQTVYTSCWDGSQVEEGAACPVQPSVQCWDGSTVLEASACPVQPPVAVYDPCAEGNLSFVVYFPWDESVLTDQAQGVIANATNTANQCNVSGILVDGHADSSGAASYNVGLSQRRINSVVSQISANGVSTTNVAQTAKGETELAVATGDGVREPLNRRAGVVIQLLTGSTITQ